MPAIENQDEVDRVRAYMQALQKEISSLGILPRTFARFPFDHIGLALLSKAFSISNVLLLLLEAGFAEEAFGLIDPARKDCVYAAYFTSGCRKYCSTLAGCF
jgi:hypothetical protein